MSPATSEWAAGGSRAPRRWDVIVVGAGPGGAMTALGLARRGASVLLLERQRFPRWKVCGACLSPGALAALDSVQLREVIHDAGARPLKRFSLAAGSRTATLPLRGHVALSRAALDQALVRAASAAGAVFREGRQATLGELLPGHRQVHVRPTAQSSADDVEETHTAAVVVDATGLGRGLRPRVGGSHAERPISQREALAGSRVGVGATFDDELYELEEGELRMVVGSMGYVGLVRVEGGRLNIGVAVDPVALKGLGPSGAVAAILAESHQQPLPADPAFGWRGTPGMTRSRKDVAAERLLRLGDAAGYVEPFTGEGMCWAMDSGVTAAELVARALDGWGPSIVSDWETYQGRALRRAQRLCRVMAWTLRRPTLARGLVGLLGVAPDLAEPFVRAAGARPRRAMATAG